MKEFWLYNTKSRKKEIFTAENKVGIYCCGPTVYGYAHIGNMRTYIFEDVLRRILEYLDYEIKHVMNITDVGHLTGDADSGDDKMEKGATRDGKSVRDIAEFYTEAFFRNCGDLKILRPTIIPKATDHIKEMIDMVQKLVEKGYTYETADGIYFDSSKFSNYAKFARLDIENLQEGHRIEAGDKKNKTDFALWKFSPKDKKRAMEWESPWGVGFPGWHIECSAMSLKYLSQPLDIHCGGIDHIPIHHTNEIAQVEAATDKEFCRFWIHGEFLVIENGKMSKSGDNFITVDTLKKQKIDPLAYRYFCYSSHYRKQLSFSIDNVSAAQTGLNNVRNTVQKITDFDDEKVSKEEIENVLEGFYKAILDDMNMPVALAEVWGILKNGAVSGKIKKAAIKKADEILALDLFCEKTNDIKVIGDIKFDGFAETPQNELKEIVDLLDKRSAAKKAKDFKTADEIRDAITAKGIEILDGRDGVLCKKL
ncbi:MAG: cysteine--tRNA ligase [Chitinispirillales bacterium]|jgi:cysteinyl-tRNA synthetase|nr:cysteine--tRNA ligase [Chitinispirillales bacterium]